MVNTWKSRRYIYQIDNSTGTGNPDGIVDFVIVNNFIDHQFNVNNGAYATCSLGFSGYYNTNDYKLINGVLTQIRIDPDMGVSSPFFNENENGPDQNGIRNHLTGVQLHEIGHHFDHFIGHFAALDLIEDRVTPRTAALRRWGKNQTQYSPFVRDKIGWGIKQEFDSENYITDVVLSDYVISGGYFKIVPMHVNDPDQYSLVSYHRKQHWTEQARPIPGSGLLVWHVNTRSPFTSGNHLQKVVDVEAANGLWNNTACFDVDGNPLGIRNTITGLDNMDFHNNPGASVCGSEGEPENAFQPGDSFDMTTNPSSDFHRVSTNNLKQNEQEIHTGIAIKRIRDFGTYMMVDIYRNWYGGALRSDLTLQGEVIIGEDLYVWNNLTLTIAPGASLTFEDNASIIVESDGFVEINQTQTIADGSSFIVNGGTVTIADNSKIIMGTSSNELDINNGSTIRLGTLAGIEINSLANINGATFTSTYTTPTTGQYWSSIRLNDAASDNSTITDNTIQYARSGIHCYRSSPTVARNDILDISNYGIRLDYSEADVQANTVERAFHGIYIISGSPYLHLNQILDCTSTGMYTTFYSAPRLFVNTIDGTDYNGVYAAYYSAPEFGYTISGADDGRNEIINNDIGIYAHNSMPFLGGSTVGGEQVGGGNCIEDNTSYHVYAVSNANVEAEYNWWGEDVTSAMFNDLTLIDWTPILSASPCEGSNPGTSSMAILTEPNENDPDGLWQWALALGHSQHILKVICQENNKIST